MNIKQAKEQITNAIIAYRTKDEYGRACIPQHHQRPVFLMGAPGIGKTAIMEQIAQEMNLPLVSYSMTHHTRQSALGLPFITDKVYEGKSYRVSEYTMSEIIASVYETIAATGSKEGILFWMKSTAYRKRSPLPCYSFCNTRYSVSIKYPMAGL